MLFFWKGTQTLSPLDKPNPKKKGGKRREKKKGKNGFFLRKETFHLSIFDPRFFLPPFASSVLSPQLHTVVVSKTKEKNKQSSLPTNFFQSRYTPYKRLRRPLQRENLRHLGKQVLFHLSQRNLPLFLLTEVGKRERERNEDNQQEKKERKKMSLALLKNLLFAAERKRQFPTPDLVLTHNMASASRMAALIFIFILICVPHPNHFPPPPQPDNEKILPKRN